MAFAAKAGDDNLRLHALRLLCSAPVQIGQVDLGRTLALQGLAEARSLQLRGAQGRLLNMLSIVAEMQDDLMGSLDYREQSLVVARETGDWINEAITMSNMGVGRLNLGDLDGAQRDLDAALQTPRVQRRPHDGEPDALPPEHLGAVAGDEERALALARSALDGDRRAGARHGVRGRAAPGRCRVESGPRARPTPRRRHSRTSSTCPGSTTPRQAWRRWRWRRSTPPPRGWRCSRCWTTWPRVAPGRQREPAQDRADGPPGAGPRRRPARDRLAGALTPRSWPRPMRSPTAGGAAASCRSSRGTARSWPRLPVRRARQAPRAECRLGPLRPRPRASLRVNRT